MPNPAMEAMRNPASQSQPPDLPPTSSDQRSGFRRLRQHHQTLINLVTQISADYPIRATFSAANATHSAARITFYKYSLPPEGYNNALDAALFAALDAESAAYSAMDELDEAEKMYSRDAPTDAAEDEATKWRLWEMPGKWEAAKNAAKSAIEEYMEAAKRFARLTDGVDLLNVGGREYDQQVATLVEDVKYTYDHVGSLESSANSDRANEILIDLMDAAATRSALDFTPDSENLKNLLQMVAKLKLWIPRDQDSGDKDTVGPTKKKKGSPFMSRKETQNVAAGIVNELFDLKCRQWGMSGLLDAYDHLQDHEKLCLLCFSAFPCEVDKESDPKHGVEKSLEIKNRILIHLWVGEQFIDSGQEGTIEEKGEEVLRVLTEKGFIEPVEKKGPRTENGLTGSSRMHPFVHSFVMTLAKRAGFFEFGDGGKITAELGRSERACLLRSQGKHPSSCQLWGSWANETDSRWRMTRFQTIQTLFNVDESIIEVKKEWFSKMKHLKVLHLGSWSGRTTEHIEVEDQKFLKEVKIMKQMRLLSLQGVSTILELPDSVTELGNLVILNLRECQSLEKLPHRIGSLGNLTHLDLTNCHLLTKLPRGIRKLSKLKVLKGFVISEDIRAKGCNYKDVFGYVTCLKKDEACTLNDLKEVKELRELSIVVNRKQFPNDYEIDVFTEMSELRILRISWEGSFEKDNAEAQQGQVVQSRGLRDNKASLGKIEKLELLCMPYDKAPNWLVPAWLEGLKKLYIKGGALESLRRDPIRTWNVETLRLKYMRELLITWVELKEMFPKMKYLESYECDKLKHFPCDQEGIWKKENELNWDSNHATLV